jgi:DnaJ-class molecular chaperone
MNPYEVFGITPSASPDLIRKTYRKLSLLYHPDKPTGDTNKFQELNAAYDKLMQPKSDTLDYVKDSKIESMMEAFFSTPIMVPITITMYQSYTGCKLPVTVERWEVHHRVRETIYVDIPPGIDSNEHIMISHKTPPVCVVVTVHNETQFVRKGLDLWYTHSLTLKEAFCGFIFELEYIDRERFRIKTPRGTIVPPNYKKRIPKRGMKRDNEVGELVIEFMVAFPAIVSESTLECIEKLF